MTYQNAFKKYGRDVCRHVYHLNRHDGEGANTIGFYLGLTTRQADAAIDAWDRYLDVVGGVVSSSDVQQLEGV